MMSELPRAMEIILRKFRPMAPPFHQHIAKNKLLGKPCQVGDRIVVYEVVETVPQGTVTVTSETNIRFE